MTLPIRILPRAKQDYRTIFAYIERRSPDGAIRWKAAFLAQADIAANDPERFPLAAENELTNLVLRDAIFKTPSGLRYRFVFTALEGQLLILRLRGPGQPPLTADEVAVV